MIVEHLADMLRGIKVEYNFAALTANGGRDLLDEHGLAVNREGFTHKFLFGFVRSTDVTCKHHFFLLLKLSTHSAGFGS